MDWVVLMIHMKTATMERLCFNFFLLLKKEKEKRKKERKKERRPSKEEARKSEWVVRRHMVFGSASDASVSMSSSHCSVLPLIIVPILHPRLSTHSSSFLFLIFFPLWPPSLSALAWFYLFSSMVKGKQKIGHLFSQEYDQWNHPLKFNWEMVKNRSQRWKYQ